MRPAIERVLQTIGKGCVGAEIGVEKGDNAYSILEDLQPKKLYLIDIGDFNGSDHNPSTPKGTFEATMERYLMTPNVTCMMMSSERASKRFKDESLDFVYIDADHSYNGISVDLECWIPKVRIGGIISGHDCRVVDVQRALKETFKKYEISGEDWLVTKEKGMAKKKKKVEEKVEILNTEVIVEEKVQESQAQICISAGCSRYALKEGLCTHCLNDLGRL